MAAAISQDDYLNDTSTFDLARRRAADASTANLQARKDALARRFAQLGNLDAGARIKQEQLASDQEAVNLANANEGINAQQASELGRRKEVIQGQQFQSGESEKGRNFSAEQAALQRAYGTSEREAGQGFAAAQNEVQRKFQTGERLSSQDFAAIQAKLGRDFTTSERQALEKYQTGERVAGQKFTADQAQKQMDLQKAQFEKTYGLSVDQFKVAKDQFEKTFAEEVRVNNANMNFAQQALDKKGFLEQILSPIGSLGKGLGNAAGGVGKWFEGNVSSPIASAGDAVSSWF